MKPHIFMYLFSFLLILALSGCGGSSGGKSDDVISDDLVADSLTNLGVDVSDTPREDGNGDPLPDDYTPFGSSKSFEQFDELVLLGFPLSASSGFDSNLTLLELDRLGSSASYDTDVLFAPDPALTPWALSVGIDPDVLRVAARGDIDRDGLEELVVVSRLAGVSEIILQIYEDQTQSFSEGQTLTISTDPAYSLAIASGDFNGDGYAELVIGLVFDDYAELVFVNNENGSLSLSTISKTLPQAFSGSEIDLIIESGNLDYDPSHELVVVVNELFQQAGAGNPESGTTRYFVFDDGKNNFADIADALVQADLSAVNRTAIVADVSLGDVDGDNVDEIVFAGLTSFDPTIPCGYNYLLVVLDDLVRDRAPTSAMEHEPNIHNGCSATPGELRFVHVNTPDLDGDGIAEIQANELIFEDFAQFPPWTSLMDRNGQMNTQVSVIPDESLFADDAGFSGRFSRLNSAMVVADLTSDK
ncbi:MAG: VCBS repeat-containing protein, partial [Gammaproteobacteria bacterium]|nr:VCBS repeat-containing protein [Gammaproteobacteria bacterium]